MHTKFWSEDPKERDHSEDVDVGKRVILDWILKNYVVRAWSGFIWLRVGTSGRIF
jgi:hypothetical protein